MRRIYFDRKSMKTRLVTAFIITSLIPIIFVNILAYYNTSNLVKQNVESMTHANLEQTKVSLDVWLDSYEDILFQVYTNDDIVELTDKINAREDVANDRQKLRKTLQGLFYTKDYIKSITVITQSGVIVSYNQLTSSTTHTSWMDSLSMPKEELYRVISSDNKTHLIPTGDKVVFGSSSCYLFHIGHRIIDYKNVKKQCGIVLVSIDEKLLEEICSSTTEGGLNFLIDGRGHLISCRNSEQKGRRVFSEYASEIEKKSVYESLARKTGIVGSGALSVYSAYDEKTGWCIIRAVNQEALIQGMHQQQSMQIVIVVVSLTAVLAIMVRQVAKMSGSIKKVVKVMGTAGKGDLSVRAEVDRDCPTEVEIIGREFNLMMDKLKISVEKQKNAEIAALEAQINPHFIYNTLDMINWMVIDKDEYEISNMITTLARILRYGISNSNGIVTIKEETDWLKQYIFLQQTRLKMAFECHINAEPEIMALPIHKLLLQPFIENAILHGFEGADGNCVLQMDLERDEDFIKIGIRDNGRGISKSLVQEMNQGIFRSQDDRNHIGMENAITRIFMYYGERAGVAIESEPQQGTFVQIRIPIIEESGD